MSDKWNALLGEGKGQVRRTYGRKEKSNTNSNTNSSLFGSNNTSSTLGPRLSLQPNSNFHHDDVDLWSDMTNTTKNNNNKNNNDLSPLQDLGVNIMAGGHNHRQSRSTFSSSSSSSTSSSSSHYSFGTRGSVGGVMKHETNTKSKNNHLNTNTNTTNHMNINSTGSFRESKKNVKRNVVTI